MISNSNDDTVIFGKYDLGMDHIVLGNSFTTTYDEPSIKFTMQENTNKNGFWKYNEEKSLKS